MATKLSLLLLAFASLELDAILGGSIDNELSQLISSTKAELAQSFLKQRLVKKDVAKVDINYDDRLEVNMTHSGELGGLFRSSNENFIFNGSRLLQLRRQDSFNNSPFKYSLESVNEFGNEEGAIFFKQIDWKNIFFLVVCYNGGYCRVLMSHSPSDFTLQQRISFQTTPVDLEFFEENDQLFLVIVRDPCRIYRWTGAYFDEHDELATSGAKAVAVFREKDNVVIVVAQSLPDQKVYSKVFARRDKKFELIQLLQTEQPLAVVHYSLTVDEDLLNFIFVLNGRGGSSVFWWNGREFSPWKSLEDVFGPGRIHVDRLQSELFVFFYDQNQLRVYHPTATTFDLVHVLAFNQDIVGVDVRQEPNESPILVVLTGSILDPFFTINLLPIVINYVPTSDDQVVVTDPLLQCLFDLKKTLDNREKRLEESVSLSKDIGKKEKIIQRKDLSVAELELKSYKINHLKVNPPGKRLEATPTEIRRNLDKLVEESKSLLAQIQSVQQNIQYQIHGDVHIGKMKASRIQVKSFGDRVFDLGSILSVTKNQTLSGAIRLATLSTKSLTAPTINGFRVNDLLLRNKPMQEISGEHTLQSLKARSFVFGELGKLNGKAYSEIAKSSLENISVRKKKVFPSMSVGRLQVENINNMSADDWLSKVLPSFHSINPGDSLNFDNLTVKNLTVTNINGVPWMNYLEDLNQSTSGRPPLANHTRVKYLVAKKINGIPVDSFMTKDTPQNISSTIELESAQAIFVKPKNFERVAESSSETDGSGSFKIFNGNLTVKNIIFENPVNISGRIVDLSRLDEIYWMKSREQTVKTPITFTRGITVEEELQVRTVNGHSVDSFVRTDLPNNVTGRLIFEDAEILGEVLLSPDVNQNVNLRKLNATAVKSTGQNLITGKKTFLGTIETKHLHVDSVNISDVFGLTKSDGFDSLEKVEIVGNVTVKRGINLTNLNGDNFDWVISTALMLDDPQLLERGNYSSLTVKELNLEKINGVDARKMLKYLRQEKELKIIVEGDLQVPEITAQTVNGIRFNEYMSKVVFKNGTSQTIRGRKTFMKPVTVRENLDGLLNDYNFTELKKIALSKTRPQVITGFFTVDKFYGDNLEAETIGGVAADRILLEDKPTTQVIRSDMVFSDIAVAGDLKTSNFMNNCDLCKVTDVNLKNVKKIGKLNVEGDLTWSENRRDYKGISYLYENGVTKVRDQIITGSVVFADDVAFQRLNTKHHINDIDLEFIVNDALYQSVSVQEMAQDFTFKGTLKADNILVMNNVIADKINGLDILDFDQRLVRNSADTEVRGKKEFLYGFGATNLNIDSINGAKIEQIIFYDKVRENDTINFPPTTFRSVKTTQDLTVLQVNDINLDDFLGRRLSKRTNQTVSGHIEVDGTVIIKGNAVSPRINDVDIEETILADGETLPRTITGRITFNDTLSIPEKIEVRKLNGFNITDAYERALLNDRDFTVEGNVIFAAGIESHGNIDILRDTNGCDFNKIKNMEIPQDIGRQDMLLSRAVQLEIDKMANASQTLIKPIVFTHLEKQTAVDVGLVVLEKSSVTELGDSVQLDLYGMDYDRQCGLPSDCSCPMQTRMLIAPKTVSAYNTYPRYYKYFDRSRRVEVTVTTTSVSYNSRCQQTGYSADMESTTVSWKTIEDEDALPVNMTIFTGFLSDVRFFEIDESIYIVLAFSFHPMNSQTNTLNVTVYELDLTIDKIKKIQEMASTGAQALDVFWTPEGVVMVVGNGYDSEIFTDSVDSAIYRFDSFKNMFKLLRHVKTHGILSIANVRSKKNSFIFLVQKQSWPFLILKYNSDYDNYYVNQKLDISRFKTKSNYISASAFTTERPGYEGDIFVGLVASDESFRLFKYKYIEGFVEVMRQEQKNVKLLQPFSIGLHQYLFAASSGTVSRVYEIISDGFSD